LSWELKRELVEKLVGGMRVDTFQENGKRCAAVTVTYRFASTVDTCTDRHACVKSEVSMNRECRNDAHFALERKRELPVSYGRVAVLQSEINV
jgi:hypothetical protein